MSLPTEIGAIAPTEPDLSLCWAVTSAPAVGTAIAHLDHSILFDDLHQAFEYAQHGSKGCTLVVWGVHGDGPVVALAHDGAMFYQTENPPPAPSNYLRSAFPWVINPCEEFSVEPGLSKREWMAATVAVGIWNDGLSVGDVADDAIALADALLARLGANGIRYQAN